jgi:hypothetical protein
LVILVGGTSNIIPFRRPFFFLIQLVTKNLHFAKATFPGFSAKDGKTKALSVGIQIDR